MKIRVKLGEGRTHCPMPDGRHLAAAAMPQGGFTVERDLHVRKAIACGDLVAIEPVAETGKAVARQPTVESKGA